LHRLRNQTNSPDIQITDDIYNEGLILIENQCLTIANKLLIEVGMIAPNRSMHDAFNQELNQELQHNVVTLQEFARNNVPLLNEQQKPVFETLLIYWWSILSGRTWMNRENICHFIDFGHYSIKM